MKRFNRVLALVLSFIIIIGFTSEVDAAKKKKYSSWQSTYEKNYDYRDGKWILNWAATSKYKKKKLVSSINENYDYDSETQTNTLTDTFKYKYSNKKNKYTTKKWLNGKYSGKEISNYGKKKDTYKNYNSKNKLTSSSIHYFDKHGRTTKYIYKYKGQKKQTTTYKYTTRNGRTIKEIRKEPNGDKNTTTYSYWSNGNIKKSTSKSKWSKYTYYDDKLGRTTKSIDENSSYKHTTTYKYLNKKSWYEKERIEITYNKKKKKVESKVKYTYKRKFDKHKNLLEEIEYKDGEPYQKREYGGYKKFTYYY